MHSAHEIIAPIVFIKGTHNNIFEVLTFKITNMKCVCYLYCCGLLMYNDMYNKVMRFFYFILFFKINIPDNDLLLASNGPGP